MSAFGPARSVEPVATVRDPARTAPTWPIALVASLVGAALCGGVLALTGNLAVDTERAVEKVKVTPVLSSPMLADEASVDALLGTVSPSVVRLVVTTEEGRSRACGVVIRDDGIVVTSAHEVTGATNITVVLADGRELAGEVVGVDLPSDVGVLRVDVQRLTVAVLGSTDALRPGAATMVVGATPEGETAVSTGVVSAVGQRLDVGDESLHGLIQTDAPIQAGWSGGPLLDESGAVIGITTDLAGDRIQFGFATPIELVRQVADELLRLGKVARGWLGIEGVDLTDAAGGATGAPSGAEVRHVMAGGPAAKSGLEVGDVITEVGGVEVRSTSDLIVALRRLEPGEQVMVGYWRDGRHHETEVTIDHHPGG